MFKSIPQWRPWLSVMPILWFCSIPLGNSCRSIFFVGALISILMQESLLTRIKPYLHTPWFYTLIAAIVWSCISMFWSPGFDHQTKFYLKKIGLLLLMPIMVLGFREEWQKKQSLNGFLICMFIPFFIAILKQYVGIQWHGDHDPGSIFYNHIITGFYTAFAAYLAFEMFFQYQRYWYLIAWGLFSFQVMCINPGRAAYGVYAILISYALWTKTQGRVRWIMMSLLVLGSILLGILSPAIHQGYQGLLNDWHMFQSGQLDTSLGFRLQFHHFAYTLFQKHWLIGGGLGSFDYWFKHLTPVPGWPYSPNTHSQYWFFASDLGVIGLLLWGTFFVTLGCYVRSASWLGLVFIGLLLGLAFNFLTDNMLFASPASLIIGLWGIVLAKPSP